MAHMDSETSHYSTYCYILFRNLIESSNIGTGSFDPGCVGGCLSIIVGTTTWACTHNCGVQTD